MYLKNKTLEKIRKMSEDKEYDWFFNNIQKENLSYKQSELLEKITEIALEEFSALEDNDKDKLKFFIKLGMHICES